MHKATYYRKLGPNVLSIYWLASDLIYFWGGGGPIVIN